MPVPLGEDVVALLRRPSTCYIATTMPDGSPQLTQTWVDTDGEHVLINSVESHQKTRNIARDEWARPPGQLTSSTATEVVAHPGFRQAGCSGRRVGCLDDRVARGVCAEHRRA
ncbi:pyridoxamine 5'-phosphate oxidase family protein [Streptomyces sp. NPDC006539]|uniref:pyridoxamine 5'-phosphate oxidase family protein n=1 Tax=Streptomyces sp. NPDC006539 TaxID=3155352 RepID=UPI0033B92DFB